MEGDWYAFMYWIYPVFTIQLKRQHLSRDVDTVEHHTVLTNQLLTFDEMPSLLDKWMNVFEVRLQQIFLSTQGPGFILFNFTKFTIVCISQQQPNAIRHYVMYPKGYEADTRCSTQRYLVIIVLSVLAAFASKKRGRTWEQMHWIVCRVEWCQ